MTQQFLLLIAFAHEVLQLRVFRADALQHSPLLFVIRPPVGQARLVSGRQLMMTDAEPGLQAVDAASQRARILHQNLGTESDGKSINRHQRIVVIFSTQSISNQQYSANKGAKMFRPNARSTSVSPRSIQLPQLVLANILLMKQRHTAPLHPHGIT